MDGVELNIRAVNALESIADSLGTLVKTMMVVAEKPPLAVSLEIPKTDSPEEHKTAFLRYALARNSFGLSTDPEEYSDYSAYSLIEMAKVYEELAIIDPETMNEIDRALEKAGGEE